MKGFLTGYVEAFRRVFGDGGVVLLMVGAIAIYAMFYPLPYLKQVVKEAPIAVVDLDQTSVSRQLVRWVDAHENVEVTLRTTDPRAAGEALAAGRIDGYLIIPSGLRRDLLLGRKAVVDYAGDGGRFLVLKQVLGGIAEAAGTLSGGVEVRRLLAGGMTTDGALAAQSPVAIRLHPLFNTREGYGAYLIPAVYVLILQQTLILGVGMILGTARTRPLRMRGTPDLGPPTPMRFAGHCAGLSTLYGAHTLFFVGFAFWVFDMPRHGALGPVVVFLAPFIIASVLFAHVLGGCCHQREASIQALLVTSIPFLFLAGFAWPFDLMPEPVRWLARLVPSTAGIQGVLRLDQMGAPFPAVASWWWTLWGLCVVYAWPAWRQWRRAMTIEAAKKPA